ncbi:MAG TPA: hypothetical protein VHL09_17265 [Dehalococcoidia bacterium]|nr:hypothetical protein [Dehalococcoidia bacterium]
MDSRGSSRGGRQVNLRVSRELGGDRSRTVVGPLGVQVLEGLRALRLSLDETAQGTAFDLTFEATAPPHARLPMMHLVRDGQVINHTCHFNQSGQVRGWVVVAGERFEVTPDRWWAVRDHSWGIREGVGGPPVEVDRPSDPNRPPARWRPANPFIAAQFPESYLFVLGAGRTGITGELIPTRDQTGSTVRMTSATLDLKVQPGTIKLAGAEAVLSDESGRQYALTAEPWATFYLAGGGYGGHGGFWHGRHRGAYHEEGETWDLGDLGLIARIAGRDDHVCLFRLDGTVGYGVFELGLRGQEPYAPFGEA